MLLPLKPFAGQRFKGGYRDPLSHRGEGAIYKDSLAKPSSQDMPGPPKAKKAKSRKKERLPGLMGLYPDPTQLQVSSPPPPPPLPESGSSSTMPLPKGEKSQMTEKFDQATDVRNLAAHNVVPELRKQLENIFEPAGTAQQELAATVDNRVIIVHGPTGTGKSTVIP